MHGWIILDKPLDLGSTQAVGAVKRNLREAGLLGRGKNKVKVGHGGTLDPLATGILPIALGEATKLAGRLLDASKSYDFTIGFGVETDTLDREGRAVAISDTVPTRDGLMAALEQFTGPIEQVPPAYSALKVDGRRAYDLARAGEDVALATRQVEIYSLDIADEGADAPPRSDRVESVTLTAHVSKGTYIRSLARDIALTCGSVGHVTMLRRTRAGPFDAAHAISLDKLNEIGKGAPLDTVILPFEAGLADIPALDLDPDTANMVRQGRKMDGIAAMDGQYWARDGEGSPVALIELEGGVLRILRGFNL